MPDAPVRGLSRTAPGAAAGGAGPDGSSVAPPDGSSGSASAPPEPVQFDHPRVLDTGRLAVGTNVVSLFGVVGLDGAAAEDMQSYLAATDDRVTCLAQTSTDFVCLLSDGTDLAEVGLLNGAARTKDDAPDPYREQESSAQSARRGIWSDLPPPPIVLTHPAVKDTATLVVEGQSYPLDGLQGLGAPFAGQFQGYIAAHGDTLSCQPQAQSGRYVCLMSDNTDVATAALVNGAALVAGDAPDTYRIQQRDALANRRGYWLHPASDVVVSATRPVTSPACCALPPGDQGSDGVSYVGGVPAAQVGGETVFLLFAGAAGWGYYDHGHRWHAAPDGYRAHMDRYHPQGQGLRGYGGGSYGGGSHGRSPGGPTSAGATMAGMASRPGMLPGQGFSAAPARPSIGSYFGLPGLPGAAAIPLLLGVPGLATFPGAGGFPMRR